MSQAKHFRLPAEWEPCEAVMLTWPHQDSDWQADLDAAHAQFLQLADLIIEDANLIVVCPDNEWATFLETRYRQKPHSVSTLIAATNDTWARDHGPVTRFWGQRRQLMNFHFNGWGNKYDCQLDNRINTKLFKLMCFDQSDKIDVDWVLEGGSIDSNGQGLLLTTSQCLLNPNRNPDYSKKELDAKLRDLFGLHKVLWLDSGYLAGDDTDAHIDTLARFTDTKTIAYVQCLDERDEHYEELSQMQNDLQRFVDLSGQAFNLIPLPVPSSIYAEGTSERLPATYANFLIVNQTVLCPTYNVPEDEIALNQLATAFPNHQIKSLNCLTLIKQHGSLHCVTMQIPSEVDL